ncbi:hypothetical protein [Paraurantiacibacter namhicola]|uniref:DUF4142 domain-containing protein n=1 Tax=Paraurantiacibacter namhicola TaxID=645517 RepID=A0A1C7D7G8_9SPHN|nr:hypothetical protein [Paraurantiacibacter namhicola]ANU07426.1 hypothetical protein A6F65_01118 [Paraurantiacibacter namhicola]
MRFPVFPRVGAALLPAILLAACATTPDGDYPSLAVRDGERMTGSIAAPPPAPLPAVPAETVQEADSLLQQARRAHADFQAVSRRVTPALRSGAGPRREVALAELMAARSSTMIPLAELDRLYVAAAAEGMDTSAILQARGEAESLVAQEDAVIEAALR